MATEALALSSGRDVEIAVAQTLAQAGDLVQAHQLADKVNREFPLNTIVQFYSLPAIRAAIELQKKNPTKAITLLQTAAPYEMGVAFVGNLYPAYLRGLAYQQAGMPQRAAAEFQKVLDHPGVVINFVIGALAHLQLGTGAGDDGRQGSRAQVLSGFPHPLERRRSRHSHLPASQSRVRQAAVICGVGAGPLV